MDGENRGQVLSKSADRLQELLINETFQKGINATGDLVRSIKVSGIPTDKGANLVLSMEEYGYIVDAGRGGATKQGSRSWKPQLIKWIKAKGIRPRRGVTIEQLAYVIYRKINKRGYKPKPFINPAVQTFMQRFPKEYAQAFAADIDVTLEKSTVK